jgi:hypothetical protein
MLNLLELMPFRPAGSRNAVKKGSSRGDAPKEEVVMGRGVVRDGNGLNSWAKAMGVLTGQTEKAIIKAIANFEAKVQRLKTRQNRTLKKLAAQRQSSRHAVKEFRAGMARASVEFHDAYRKAINQFWSRSARKYLRMMAHTKRKRGR